MPGLRDLLRKKEKINGEIENHHLSAPPQPEFKFVRTTTDLQEVVEPPTFPEDHNGGNDSIQKEDGSKKKRHTLSFRRFSHADNAPDTNINNETQLSPKSKSQRRLSERFHLPSSRSHSHSPEPSAHVPDNLPDAPNFTAASKDEKEEQGVKEQREAQWEKRATILAQNNPLAELIQNDLQERGRDEKPSSSSGRSRSHNRSRSRSISNARGDENIQEAIRLHEIGQLSLSTAMFGRLANPQGENIALAQVLYGLALRHGWGVQTDAEKAIHYLSLAAANSANIEEQALASGMKKGGAAKGELVLAMFELANCFRHGWGVKQDAAAARQYYETAANLGDTDAMDEAAWCFLEGFGGPKDKFKAAQYLRLAEKHGSKAVGNSWIWKEKYNPK